jgi:hypothetical protein
MDDKVMVTIQYSVDPETISGTTLACPTADVSSRGMRVELSRPLEPGCVVALWVKRLDGPGTITLKAIVKWWQKREDGDTYWVGLQFDDEPSEDLLAWANMVQDL